MRDPIDRENNADPINAEADAHNTTLFDLKEELTKAVGVRKEQALPLAIQIFNKIQEKTVPTTRLENFIQRSESKDVVNVNESINKLDTLLNDSSSPIMSTLRATSKYSVDKLPETIDEYRA